MLRPSGASASTSTSAPRRRKISGAARYVAPLAQSSAIRRPRRSSSREALVQRAQVVLERAVQGAHAADRPGAVAVAARSSACSISSSAASESLKPSRAEELDPVVAVRVVRRAEHDAEVEPVAADQQRRARRRQHAAEQRLAAGGGDAGRDRGLEHLAGLARVADHEHARRARRRRARVAARASASDSSAVRNSPATPRTPSVPKSLTSQVATG